MKTKIVKFASCMSALDFIKELHDKNEKCHGLLNCNSKERTIINGSFDSVGGTSLSLIKSIKLITSSFMILYIKI